MRRPVILAAALAIAPFVVIAQPIDKPRQICFLTFDRATLSFAAPFFQKLAKLGHVEGRNTTIHRLSADGAGDKFRALAAECVRMRADVIVPQTTPAAQAAMQATSSIPIVMMPLGDPVGSGLVQSLARPGGNVTGVTFNVRELALKRLELLKEVIPTLSMVLVVTYLQDPIAQAQVEELNKVAPSLRTKLLVKDVRTADDVRLAVASGSKAGAEAMLITQESFFVVHRARIVELAREFKLPTIVTGEVTVQDGALLSFSAHFPALFERSADYVDRILKGAKPANTPVEQPSEFRLAVNMTTAKTLGISIPKSVLVRATTIID